MADAGSWSVGPGISRRRLFELGTTSVGLAAVLAACGNDDEPAAGRVGQAPPAPELSDLEVNDVVYLRTLTSLEYSIVAVYAALLEIDGLDEGVVGLLERLSEDHLAAAGEFASLTRDAGGEPYECENQWLMGRTLQPLLDHIIGVTDDGGEEIPPTDDADRDSLTTADALETIGAATAQLFVERLVDPPLRFAAITAGTAAGRRAATAALRSNPPPEGYVSPALTEGVEVSADAGVMPKFAIASRFGQLTPVDVQVGALDENGQRFSISIQTPAENAYVYEGATCPA
jgi:hypothetical protein